MPKKQVRVPNGGVYAMYHGGGSYAAPDVEDAEHFASVAAAKEAMRGRLAGRDRAFPTVDESAIMDVFTGGHPRDYADPYPDLRLSHGPRGGIRQERG